MNKSEQARLDLEAAYPISVVIPAYGRSQELEQCLAGLKSNPLAGAEVLLVDDASPQDLTPLAEEAQMRVIRHPYNRGPAAARNSGLGAASHPWVFFLDSDVVVPSEALQWIRESLDLYRHRPEVAGVLGRYAADVPGADFWTHYKNLQVCHLYDKTATVSPYLHTPMFCVRRDVLSAAGGFDSSFATAEDFRLGVLLGSRGFRFIIDRRLKGVHLKRYTWREILREDSRRLRDLARLDLPTEQRAFAYRAHRPNRIAAAAAPLPMILAALAALLDWRFGVAAAVLALLFLLVTSSQITFMTRRRGLLFGLKAWAFLFLEMTWAQLVVLSRLPAAASRRISQALRATSD